MYALHCIAYLYSWFILHCINSGRKSSSNPEKHTRARADIQTLSIRTDLTTLFNGCSQNWSSRLNDSIYSFEPTKSANAEIKSIAHLYMYCLTDILVFISQLTACVLHLMFVKTTTPTIKWSHAPFTRWFCCCIGSVLRCVCVHDPFRFN